MNNTLVVFFLINLVNGKFYCDSFEDSSLFGSLFTSEINYCKNELAVDKLHQGYIKLKAYQK